MEGRDISAVVVYELLQQLRDDVQDQHARLRSDMQAGFARLNAITDAYADHRAQLVALQAVLRERQRVSSGRLVIIIAGIATGTTVLYQALTRAWDALVH